MPRRVTGGVTGGATRRQPPDLVPYALRIGRTPVVPHPASEIKNDREIVPGTAGRRQRAAHALDAPLAGRHCAVGLERRGFASDSIENLQKLFRLLTRSGLNTSQAIERVRAEVPACSELEDVLEFIAASERGFVK